MLHELGSYGLVGGFSAQLILLSADFLAPTTTQRLLELLTVWLVGPSLILVLASGLAAMFVRKVFFKKGWVWMKMFLSVPTVYAVGATFPGFSTERVSSQTSLLVISMTLSVVITWFSVWRPKNVIPGM